MKARAAHNKARRERRFVYPVTEECTREQYVTMGEYVERATAELEGMSREMQIRILTGLPIILKIRDEVKARLP